MLDVNSRKGTRIARSLEEGDYIEREDAVYEGRVTYFLLPVPRMLDFSLLMAGDLISPFIGEDNVDPKRDSFDQWVVNLQTEQRK